ncbi:hypothetical protein HYW40_01585 [Candidatus Curtissbacteria bacterium]|nr:hypothetical protein [Candidatus Curtissbacteria bacterium]
MLPVSVFAVKHRNYSGPFQAPAAGLSSNWLKSWQSIGKVKLKILVTFSLLLCALLITQLVFAANLSTDGQKLAIVESEITKAQSEKANLKAEIARQSSLLTLSAKAKELGFTSSPKIIAP